ncbi:MAG: ABC transporter substrate-binding protein, partial [Chloroflexota bacterium]
MLTPATVFRFSSRAGAVLARPAMAVALCGSLALQAGHNTAQAGPSRANQVTLVFEHQWIGPQEGYLKDVIKRYEKLHPNIVIKESVVADTTKIITALSGGKPPDIVDFGLGQFVPELASKGALANLDPYIAASHLKMSIYVPASVQVVTYDGHVYGLPFMNFNHALLYNRALFRKAGIAHPPSTLEELQADAYRLTKVDSKGKILQMGFIPDWPGGANGQA